MMQLREIAQNLNIEWKSFSDARKNVLKAFQTVNGSLLLIESDGSASIRVEQPVAQRIQCGNIKEYLN